MDVVHPAQFFLGAFFQFSGQRVTNLARFSGFAVFGAVPYLAEIDGRGCTGLGQFFGCPEVLNKQLQVRQADFGNGFHGQIKSETLKKKNERDACVELSESLILAV